MPNISEESLNSGQGFKTTFIPIRALIVAGNQNSNFTQLPIFFARGTNRVIYIYIIITVVRLSICLYVRLCVTQLLPHFLTDYKNKGIYGFLEQRGRFSDHLYEKRSNRKKLEKSS